MADRFPMPRIDDLLHAVKASRYFIALDLGAGYWQISLDPASVDKTAFRTHLGLFEFLKMPFNLVNAPMTFQRIMWIVFGDLYRAGVLCYLDDILVHARTVRGVIDNLREVFKRLRASGLTLNLAKCKFLPVSMKYL